MTITAAMVKELRERTGVGMMECKKALTETNGDMEAAIEEMRERGQAKAAKRAGKIAAEGVIRVVYSANQKSGYIVEINSETDFVAREEQFRQFADAVAQRGLELSTDNVDVLLTNHYNKASDQTIEQAREGLVTKLGENIKLRRAKLVKSSGVVGSYIHGDRIGVLVAIDQDVPELAKEIAMHIAASNPQAVDESQLSQALLDKEAEIFTAQAQESGKPADIIKKMVQGRIAKFVKEICLVDQPFVKNPDQTIADLLKQHKAKVLEFVRFEVGEGIEKETVDFAEEVHAQLQGGE